MNKLTYDKLEQENKDLRTAVIEAREVLDNFKYCFCELRPLPDCKRCAARTTLNKIDKILGEEG
jgi:hypothetical protein